MPLVHELVTIDDDVLAEQRGLHTPDLTPPTVDGLTIERLRAEWEEAEPLDPTAFHRDADGVDVRVLAHPELGVLRATQLGSPSSSSPRVR